MIIDSFVVINADIQTVWHIFTDLSCWKDWNTVVTDAPGESSKGLVKGEHYRFCIRPFALPIRLEPVIDEVIPYEKITWSARKFGVLARHVFLFEKSASGVKVSSIETFTGFRMVLATFILSKRRLRSLTKLLLQELKLASESFNKSLGRDGAD